MAGSNVIVRASWQMRLCCKSSRITLHFRAARSPLEEVRSLSTSCRLNAKAKGASRGTEKSAKYPPLPDGWRAVIGVECHAQIKSPAKLFSPTPIPPFSQHTPPNEYASPFDAAYPGTLPRLNHHALNLAIRGALALNCTIPSTPISWDRKHYFYADLPHGWQITQRYAPLAHSGSLALTYDEGFGFLASPSDEVVVRIEQVQVEQDTAKSTHVEAENAGSGTLTLIDLNRAGQGLMEIVSAPDMSSPAQAGAYVRRLQEILRRVGASDGNMDEGSLRCDVNVSVHRKGEPLGTRCEVKNVNSVRFVMNAIAYETHRQHALLSAGEVVVQQTRAYDEATGTTIPLRTKEDALDYRYMPDPNLPSIVLDESTIAGIRSTLPELPDARRTRLLTQYGISARDVAALSRLGMGDLDKEGSGGVTMDVRPDGEDVALDAVDYFEAVAQGRSAQTAANWVIHELPRTLNLFATPFSTNIVPARVLGELIDLLGSDVVTGSTAKALLSGLVASSTGNDSKGSTAIKLDQNAATALRDYVNAHGLRRMILAELGPLVDASLDAMPDEASRVRAGDAKVLNRLVGDVMKRSKGRGDARDIEQLLKSRLGAT